MVPTSSRRPVFVHAVLVISLLLSTFLFTGAQAQEPTQEDDQVNKVFLPLLVTAEEEMLIFDDTVELSPDGVQSEPEAKEEEASEQIGDSDELMKRIAEQVPGFGGLFYDENGQLTMYVTGAEPGVQQMTEARISAVLGTDNQFAAAGPVRVVTGQYDFLQLKGWHERMSKDVLGVAGVVLVDVDERSNRLRVGVEKPEQQAAVKDQIAKLGIPEAAINVEVTEPISFASHTLRSRVRPLQGGLQINFGNFVCTLGFLAVRSGVQGMVTNSHCTNIQGGVENTIYHQASASGTTNRIALEIRDPAYFTGSGCPAGRRCRYSDTSFARIPHPSGPSVTINQGYIARTTALNSLVINHSAPRFRIVSETAFPVTGQVLNKMGRTTGWSQGSVGATCANVNVSGTNITLLCQDFVNARSAGGDSGSPVFRITNSPSSGDVSLYGILWGGNSSGTQFVFSAIGTFNVQRSAEMGAITTCAAGFSC